jgi:glutathione synthase/RimK-type ligase-like ATP-grasp enzyme
VLTERLEDLAHTLRIHVRLARAVAVETRVRAVKVAFATCRSYELGHPDDHGAAALVGAEFRVWNDPAVDWDAFDRIVIRSVWDYTSQLDAFLEWCERVGSSRLRNRPDLVAFNADKRYLTQLEVPTVPTSFVAAGDPTPLLTGEVVVKPSVSAGARDTGRFPADRHRDALALINAICMSGRVALVQPYLPLVDERGETAIVYIGGEVSHVLHKRPVLRSAGVAPLGQGAGAAAAVMSELGLVSTTEASDGELELAAAAHAQISQWFATPLYARIDLVPGTEGEPVLVEVEAIDPSLYFGQVPGAARKLAGAILSDRR